MAANGNSMSNIIIRRIKQIQISTGRFIFGAHFYESINIYFHEHTVVIQLLTSKILALRIVLLFNDKNKMILRKLSDKGKSVIVVVYSNNNYTIG